MTAPAPRPQGERPPRLVPVPTPAETQAFERFLAGWLAEVAERRIRRQVGR